MSPHLTEQAGKFLLETTSFVIDHEKTEVDLLIVPTPDSFGLNNTFINSKNIMRVAEEWQSRGWGTLRFDGRPNFAFNEKGFAAANVLRRRLGRRSWRQRLRGVYWVAVNSVAAVIAAVAASFAAYFSYLALAKN